MTLYYKMQLILLQNATVILLKNATEVYYKMRQVFYYKIRQFFLTKCDIYSKYDSYYKMRRSLKIETAQSTSI